MLKRDINGILLLDKPSGMTSNGVLQRVKRSYCAKKAGHTGNLDPIATGMLPICFGEATKFSQFLLDADKSYVVTAKLGEETTTGDCEGEITKSAPVQDVTRERIESIMQQFTGEIDQVPPMFSALKHQGEPLYKLARRGIHVERKARRITIFSIRFISLSQDELQFEVHCSKGTYVRTLVEDIGRELCCGAHVTALRRTMVSPYQQGKMITLPELEAISESHQSLLDCLLPVETSVNVFPAVKLCSSAAYYLRMGQPVRTTMAFDSLMVRLLSEDGHFLGVGEVMTDGRVKPHRLVL